VVDALVQRTIDELFAAAERHDAVTANRLERWRVLEPDAGRLLWFLTQAVCARMIIEVGTSRGVSTLWLADAARSTGGRVLSLDTDGAAQQDARQSVARAGLSDYVIFQVVDGGVVLGERADGDVDLLFLDAERTEYASWWPHPVRVLRPGGVLVADNALSHPEEIAPLRELIDQDSRFHAATTVAVGKGELLAMRQRDPKGTNRAHP
jgi:predicted O-methyltransferase YrrM